MIAAGEIDLPDVKAEVEAAFAEYEQALVENDVALLDGFFLVRADTMRYGVGENLRGHAAIAAYRTTARWPAGTPRRLDATVITTFGKDCAVASTLFRGVAPGKIGRQMQTWVRMADGWKIVAAHISVIDDPG